MLAVAGVGACHQCRSAQPSHAGPSDQASSVRSRTCRPRRPLLTRACSSPQTTPPQALHQRRSSSTRAASPVTHRLGGPPLSGCTASLLRGLPRQTPTASGRQGPAQPRLGQTPCSLKAFRKEERLWCVHCHAPLAAQRDQYLDDHSASKPSAPAETTATTQTTPTTEAATIYTPDSAPHALLDEGINCAACHVRGGHILGPRPSQNPAHPVVASAYLSSPTFCADCHQFNFPDFSQGHIGYTDSPMQDTLAEWRAASPGATCAGCHYRDGHRLVGPHDVEWMRSKFKDFQYQARGPLLSVQLNVSARGHLVPSGDLFHSLSLEISQDPDFTTLYAQHKWARFFTKGVLEPGVIWDRALARNTGLLPKTRRVSLTLDMPPAGPTFIRLVYHYHDQALGGANPLPPDALRLVLWTAQAR
jgi:hypothetical protein